MSATTEMPSIFLADVVDFDLDRSGSRRGHAVIRDFLVDDADQMRALRVVELETEVAFGVGLGASGFFHALAQAEQDDFVARGGLADGDVLDRAGQGLGGGEGRARAMQDCEQPGGSCGADAVRGKQGVLRLARCSAMFSNDSAQDDRSMEFVSWSRSSRRRRGRGFEARDFGQQRGGFVLQGSFQRLVVDVGHFAGFEFEVQVAQILVDGIFALAQVRGPGLLRAKIELAGSRKCKTARRRSPADSRLVRCVISRSPCAPGRGIVRVRRRAQDARPSARAGAGRFFHARTTIDHEAESQRPAPRKAQSTRCDQSPK